MTSPVVDLRSKNLDTPKLFYFHVVFQENWPNNSLAYLHLRFCAPHLGTPRSASDHRNCCAYFMEIVSKTIR